MALQPILCATSREAASLTTASGDCSPITCSASRKRALLLLLRTSCRMASTTVAPAVRFFSSSAASRTSSASDTCTGNTPKQLSTDSAALPVAEAAGRCISVVVEAQAAAKIKALSMAPKNKRRCAITVDLPVQVGMYLSMDLKWNPVLQIKTYQYNDSAQQADRL